MLSRIVISLCSLDPDESLRCRLAKALLTVSNSAARNALLSQQRGLLQAFRKGRKNVPNKVCIEGGVK